MKADAVVQKCSLIKKCVLRNFAKFTGKHMCQNLFLNKKRALLKKRLWHRCFPVNFCEISKYTFSYRTLPVAASVKTTQLTTKLIAIT